MAGAITVLLKDAIDPNLVQTTENSPAFIHGGPFANIAHGCNSVIATKVAMSHADYVITEAGFGADLGAEKFFNIKCRKAGIAPKLTVIVATTQALKMHGSVPLEKIREENIEGLNRGFENLDKHIANMKSFGQNVVVTLNKFATDTNAEIDLVKQHCEEAGVGFALNEAFLLGGEGAVDLAKVVVETINTNPSGELKYTYANEEVPEIKKEKIVKRIYRGLTVKFSDKAKKKLTLINRLNINYYPVCIAKTQYSFSDDPQKYGVAKDFTLTISDIVINNGAEFIVAIAGNIMRMPGLPKNPQANYIDLVDGMIEGLS